VAVVDLRTLFCDGVNPSAAAPVGGEVCPTVGALRAWIVRPHGNAPDVE
jgi:hypothetical protein